MTQKEISLVISNLRHSLFTEDASPKNVSSHDVTLNGNSDNRLYGITVNIKPTFKMNRKYWNSYEPHEQCLILERILNNYLKKTPSISLKELHFETCPKLKMMHFHAMIECEPSFFTDIICYFERFSGNDENTKVPWRVIQGEQIYDEKGWIAYIKKELD